MTGLIFSGALCAVALFLLVKGLRMQHYERALMKRLVPTKARVTDPGDRGSETSFTMSDGTERRDVTYEGAFEYVVGGRSYTGTATASSPVFGKAQMPPNEITVFYDSTDPSKSRLAAIPDTTGRSYVGFAMLVFAVALGLAVIPNLELLLGSRQN